MNAREQQIADSAQRWRAQGCCDRANTEMLRVDALYLKFRATCGQKTGANSFSPIRSPNVDGAEEKQINRSPTMCQA